MYTIHNSLVEQIYHYYKYIPTQAVVVVNY